MDLYDELPWSELLYDEEFTALLDATKQHQVSVVELLTVNAKELARILQRSINEVSKFQEVLSLEFNKQLTQSKPRLTAEIEDPKSFSTTDVSIDDALGGGIHTHGITEIFGESSTGKSQLLMQLSLAVQLPPKLGGLGGKCVYITTEGDLPTQRLQEMIASRPEFKENGVSQDNIFTVSCNDLVNQEHILNVQLPILLENHEGAIKLVIIDSISHHLRVELESKSFKDFQGNKFYIDQMAEGLLNLARKHLLAIVVANQVGDKPLSDRVDTCRQDVDNYEYQLGWMVGWKDSTILYRQKYNEPRATISNNNEKTSRDLESILSDDDDARLIEQELIKVTKMSNKPPAPIDQGNKRKLQEPGNNGGSLAHNRYDKIKKRKMDNQVPNLGLAWANHVATRILTGKTYKASSLIKRGELHLYKGTDPSAFWQVRRTMKVVFSTYAEPSQISFVISRRGIETVSA